MYCSRTLQLYILKEALKVFILAAVAVNLVMNFGAILTFLHKLPLPIVALMKVVMYQMPQLFPWTFPMALLLALTLTYGRMAADNEVMAMQASGIHMMWVVLPGALLGAGLTVGLYFVNDYLLPYCKTRQYEVTREEVANMLPEIFRSKRKFDIKRFELEWDGMKGNTIYKLRVTQRNDKGATVMTCVSDTATYEMQAVTDPATKKTSYQLVLTGEKVSGMNYPDVHWTVQEKVQSIPLTSIEPRDPGAKAGSIADLKKYLAGLEQEIPETNEKLKQKLERDQETTRGEIASLKERLRNPDIEEMDAHRMQLRAEALNGSLEEMKRDTDNRIKANDKRLRDERNDVLIKIHTRLSLAFSALALALVGMPLGIIGGRSHMLKAFMVACVPVLIFYYPLFLLATNLAEEHKMSEATAIWAPTILLAGIGAGLIGHMFRK